MRYKNFINENASTDFMETASCIGIICQKSLSDDLKKFLSTKHKKDESMDEIISLLEEVQDITGSGSYNWNRRGVSIIKNITIEEPGKVNTLFNLVVGMNEFMQDVGYSIVGYKPFFIHGDIKKYYEKEKKVFGAIPFSKENTADVIISTHNYKETLNSMTSGANADKNLMYVECSNGVKYIQVSLKKNGAEAQLGKATKILKGLYNIENTKDVVNMFTNDPPQLTTEGAIWDKIKAVASHISSLVRGIYQKVVHMFGKVNKRHLSQFEKAMGINEDIMSSSNKKLTGPSEALVMSVTANPTRAANIVNNEIRRLQEIVRNTNIPIKADIAGSFSINTPEDVFHIVSNYLTIKAVQEMASDVNGLQKNVARIVGDMFFGGTKLPLWKVYGWYGKKPYVHMKTLEIEIHKKEGLPSVDIMGVRLNKGTSSYTITIYMLNDVDERGKEYVTLRTGTNSASAPSFVIEGTGKKGPIPIDKSLIEVM